MNIEEYLHKDQGNKTIFDSLFPEINFREFPCLYLHLLM
jgi:hypothetical protein